MADSVDVRIDATGLALCFLKPPHGGGEDVWNVAFLCDELHPLSFKINGEPVPNWRPEGLDFYLRVEHDDIRPCRRGNFHKLLNISDRDYAHGVDANGDANLTIERVKRVADLIWMQVPHAKMEVFESEDTKIMQTDPKFRAPKRVPDCGKKIRLTFRITADFSLVGTDFQTGDPVFDPIVIPIDGADDGEITLSFDNDCVGQCDYNDFEQLYELVVHRDENSEEVRFVTWAEDAETEPVPSLLTAGDNEDTLRELFSVTKLTPYGNCDPVGSEPPPGP